MCLPGVFIFLLYAKRIRNSHYPHTHPAAQAAVECESSLSLFSVVSFARILMEGNLPALPGKTFKRRNMAGWQNKAKATFRTPQRLRRRTFLQVYKI